MYYSLKQGLFKTFVNDRDKKYSLPKDAIVKLRGDKFVLNGKPVISNVKTFYDNGFIIKAMIAYDKYQQLNLKTGKTSPVYSRDLSEAFEDKGLLWQDDGTVYEYNRKTLEHSKTNYSIDFDNTVIASEGRNVFYPISNEEAGQKKYSLINHNGKIIAPFVFDGKDFKISIDPQIGLNNSNNILFGVKQGDKNVLVFNGEIVEELPQMTEARYFNDIGGNFGRAISVFDAKTNLSKLCNYYIENDTCKKTSEQSFAGKVIMNLNSSVLAYENNEKVGLVNFKGDVLTKAVYDAIYVNDEKRIVLSKGDKNFYFYDNKVVSEEEDKAREKAARQKYLAEQKLENEKKRQLDKAYEKWLEEEIDVKAINMLDDGTGFKKHFISPSQSKMTRREYLEYLNAEYEKVCEANDMLDDGTGFSRHYVSAPQNPNRVMWNEFLKDFNNQQKTNAQQKPEEKSGQIEKQ